jgi:hypothetical protein
MTIKHTTSGEALMEMQARIDRLRGEIMTMHCGDAASIARWIVTNRQDIAGDVALCLMRHFVLQRTRARRMAEVVAMQDDDFMVEN